MIKKASPSFDAACDDWLRARPRLASSTIRAYRGEVNRLARHLSNGGSAQPELARLQQDEWLRYLKTLTRRRAQDTLLRSKTLRPSSALQAARITRAFLRHCHTRGWTTWAPGSESFPIRPAPRAPDEAVATHGLFNWLTAHATSASTEADLRLCCLIALTFWGALKPREIAALTPADVGQQLRGHKQVPLRVAGRPCAVLVPTSVRDLLSRYELARVRPGQARRSKTRPLIAQLGADAPLLADGIWRSLQRAALALDSPSSGSSIKQLRDSFGSLAGELVYAPVTALAQQLGKRRAPWRSPPQKLQAMALLAEALEHRLEA